MTQKEGKIANQRDRFIETAQELGADQDANALNRVFGKVVPPVIPKPPKDKKEVLSKVRNE